MRCIDGYSRRAFQLADLDHVPRTFVDQLDQTAVKVVDLLP
jgi:hypothetical protein